LTTQGEQVATENGKAEVAVVAEAAFVGKRSTGKFSTFLPD
jgi:hypothetical protein